MYTRPDLKIPASASTKQETPA